MLHRFRCSAISVSLQPHVFVCVAALLLLCPSMAWAQTSIAVARPNGAERVYTAAPYTIEWTLSDPSAIVQSIDVASSSNGGSSYKAIAGCAALPASARSCSWAAPAPSGSNARIRVTARTSGASLVDASDASFTVVTGSGRITVTAPNTATPLPIGSSRTISWTHTLGANARMRVDLSRDNGSSWQTVAAVVTSGTSSGSSAWTVAGPTAASARIRVTALNSPTSDTSDVPFPIFAPSLAIAEPAFESNWGYGTQQRIAWTTNLGSADKVNVKLSADGGATFPLTLAAQVAPNAGGVTVTIPVLGARTPSGILLVESAANPSLRSVTTRPIVIEPPFVAMIRPNAPGDVWRTGTTRSVVWRDNLGALERVRVDLSRDGGATYATALSATTPADGTQGFAVSTAWVTTTARVRITWLRNGAVVDASDANFAIRTSVTNTVPAANAGPDQAVHTGTAVRLNGGASTDADGNTLTYAWTLTARPAGSAAVLSRATFSDPSFVADVTGNYTVQLVVNDGAANSPADAVVISASSNSAPVANAGVDGLVNSGATVTLDGSASSDPDGQALYWTWTLVERPAASAATLANASGPAPSFVADAFGRYVAQLVVNDGTVNSTPDTVAITVNARPVANAGPDQTPLVGATVQLTGAASTDADGQVLTYAWTFQSRPAGSSATLSDPTDVAPTFVVDRAGSYVVRLVVDDTAASSLPSTVTINTTNSAPVAHAGPDQSIKVHDVVTLDASGSTDVDGDALQFTWQLTRPAGSTAALSDPATLQPTFSVDKAGTYVATLVARDGVAVSDPDTVMVTTLNSAPIASAGEDGSVSVGSTVVLDATGSVDVDEDAVTYAWSLTSVPDGSNADLSDPTAVRPSFVADRAGTYVAQLIVRDGALESVPDTVTFTTTNSVPLARAGDDQTVLRGAVVALDGNASFDAEFDVLHYSWAMTNRPAGSLAVLSTTTEAATTFTVDLQGTYVVQLIVSDGVLDSAPDTIIVTTINSVPVARAGDDQTTAPNATVRLDGAESTDADADPLTYSWAIVSAPAGSSATLSDSTVPDPAFVPDLPGTYVAQLIVDDGHVNSVPDTVAITVHQANRTPVAAAGPDQQVNVGVIVQLNGTESSDPDNDLLTYTWTIASAPADSLAALSDPSSAAPQLEPDQPGAYVLQLIVSDGRADSAADSVRIVAAIPPEFIGTLAVGPSSLRFSAMKDQPAPASQSFTVTLGDATQPAAWVASYSAAWLSLTPSTAAGSTDVSVRVNPAGLAAGTYKHTIAIEGPRLQGSPRLVVVTLVVDPPLSTPANPEPQTITVAAGASIQAAVNAAAPGSTILLQPGTYVQNVILPAKANQDGRYITISTAGVTLPEGRINPALKSSLAIIRSPSVIPAMRTNARASYYRIVGLAFEANKNGDDDVIRLGDTTSQVTLAQVPHHLEVDRVIITGGTTGQKRGIAVNAADVLVQNSDISNIWHNGQDSQAIAGWNTPGRVTIRNNRLEAASENILFGGADPAIPDLVAEDILVEDNLSTKNLAWRGDNTKEVKNAFELKAVRRVAIRGNIFERVWNDGQDGTAIVFKSVNQSGTCPSCASQDIVFENNIVRAAGAAIAIGGYDYLYPSGQTRGITIRNNLFYDISTSYGGNGRLLTMGNEPAEVVVDHNTFIGNGSSVVYTYAGTRMLPDGSKIAGNAITGFSYTNNLSKHGQYGIMTPSGASALSHATWLPASVIQYNVLAGATTTKYYPATNRFPTVAEFNAQFVDPATQDYTVIGGSWFGTASADGGCLGVNIGLLPPR
jgi:hypothetical protein